METAGEYPGQFELTEYEAADRCPLLFRHVNVARFAPDPVTILPSVAKSFEFNNDFTEVTFTLRRGQKWSNGEPLGTKVIDDTTFAQPLQPYEFLKQFHPDFNPDAGANAKKFGFEAGKDAIVGMWSPSNWKDVGSPWLTGTVWTPTLEPFNVVDESTEERRLVANPYFFAVDTSGRQLSYINEMSEVFIEDSGVTKLRITNGLVDYKTQGLTIADSPVLKDNHDSGNHKVQLPHRSSALGHRGHRPFPGDATHPAAGGGPGRE